MPRPTPREAKLRFEERWEAQLLQKLEIPEVRDADAAIRRGAWKRWKAGEPLQATPSTGAVSRGFATPFWLEITVCRGHGVDTSR